MTATPERVLTDQLVDPRERVRAWARKNVLGAVAGGADEHFYAAAFLRACVQGQALLDLTDDAYLAEVARGIVGALEALDTETEQRLRDAFGGRVDEP